MTTTEPTDADLLCQDPSAEPIVAALRVALERHGTLFTSARQPLPGLPALPDGPLDTVWSEDLREYLVDTPWGFARPLYATELGSFELSRFTPLYHPVRPREGVSMPQAQAPEPGFVLLDTVTGMATVYVDGEPIHSLRVYLDNKRGAYQVLDQIRSDLAKAGIPVYPARLCRADSLPYPWEEQGGDFRTARVLNREVAVPVVGFALDPQTRELVYLHIVGAKAAVRSIWATLNQGGSRRSVTIQTPGRDHLAVSSRNYATTSAPVDPETGVYRLLIVDRRAVEREVDDRAYLLVPRNEQGADLDGLFAARLDAVLPIPILPQWGRRLRQEGIRARLVRPLTGGGDVTAAYGMTANRAWYDLVEGLVQSGDLLIP